MSCVTQTKNFNTLWTRQVAIETAFKIIFLASVGHPDMWTSSSKISVQPHILITHAVISDTYMHNKSVGCTEIILKDPGADSGGKGKSKRAKKKNDAKNYFSLRHFYRLFRLSLAPTICPWVSEDVRKSDVSWNFKMKMIFIKYFPFCWSEMLRDWELQCSAHKSAITEMAFNLTNEEALYALFCCKAHRKRLKHKRTVEVSKWYSQVFLHTSWVL